MKELNYFKGATPRGRRGSAEGGRLLGRGGMSLIHNQLIRLMEAEED